jgi:CelD/BcsL family acetyltransferase involved in cellulose biosynthesis
LGYDPSYRNLSVGTFLLLHVIKEFCGNSNILSLDFNAGNDEAKRQYCDSSFKVSAIQLFGPGLRLWFPISLHLAAQGSHQLAKAISHRIRSYHPIRARWRYGG